MKKFNNFFRNNFLAGFFVLLPIVITFFIFMWLFKGFTSFLLPYIKVSEKFFEITLSPVTRRILSFIFLCCIIFFIGLFAKNYFCKKIFNFFESLLKKIPVVKTIYLSSKQIINTFLNSNGDNFSKVVLIEYPRQGIYSIAFLTNNTIPFFSNILKKKCVNVFVPTSPNPTSGFLIVVPESDVINLDMSIEDGFNYVISAGLIVPERVHSIGNIKIIKE
jgi:uncharacterized membrane protein